VYIFRGGPAGAFTGTPSFAYWGAQGGLSPEVISARFDFNGDQRGDIVLGGFRWDNAAGNDSGTAYVVTGRPYTGAGQIQVICDTYYRYEGTIPGINTGRAVVAIGDINGDNCDEFAIGSRLEDRPGIRDEGGVRILYGHGAVGCPPGPRMQRLVTGEQFGQAGWSLAAGDLTGDGIPDLAVGAWQRRTENIPVGGVWVVSGDHLRAEPLRSVVVANTEDPILLNQWGPEWLVHGSVRDGQFGNTVAIAGQYLAVGVPRDEVGAIALAGSIRIFTVDAEGIQPEPHAIMVGETEDAGSLLGSSLMGGSVGGHPAFIAGAIFGEGTGLDNGSAYVLRVEVGDDD